MGKLRDLFEKHRSSKAKSQVSHYGDVYEEQVGRLVGQAFTMLEIGVEQGASLKAWREYFGPEMTYFGMDINQGCAKWNEGPKQRIFTGSQADAEALQRVINAAAGFDLIIDDGSHKVDHQWKSLETLWPHLNPGGVYVVEDLHTSYSSSYGTNYGGGPVGHPGTMVDTLKHLVDSVNKVLARNEKLKFNLAGLESMKFWMGMCFLQKGNEK